MAQFLFQKNHFIFNYHVCACMNVYVGACAHEYKRLRRPEDGLGSLELESKTVVNGQPHTGAGN